MAKDNKVNVTNGKQLDPAVFIKQSKETELGTLARRIELAVGNCNRLAQQYPELVTMKKVLLKCEDTAHKLWLCEAIAK